MADSPVLGRWRHFADTPARKCGNILRTALADLQPCVMLVRVDVRRSEILEKFAERLVDDLRETADEQ